MKFIITARTATSVHTYSAIGNRDALMDAAYAAGAMSVSIRRLPSNPKASKP